MKSFVYIIVNDSNGAAKIGRTVDIARRLKELQTGSPSKLRVARVMAGGRQIERWLHKQFEDRRTSGEWFCFSEDMLTIQPPDELPLRIIESQSLSVQTCAMVQELLSDGFTQMQLAAETGLSQSTISRLAAGQQADTNFTNGLKLVALYNRKCAKRTAA